MPPTVDSPEKHARTHDRARLRALLSSLAETPTPLQPHPDLNLLRCDRAASGFRNVYASGAGWVAKVKEFGRLHLVPGSRRPTPQQAACFVLAYYRARYGVRWREAIRRRKSNGWRLTHSKRLGGWVLTVWVQGRMRGWATREGGSTPLVFTDRRWAVEFARHWLHLYLKLPVWRA